MTNQRPKTSGAAELRNSYPSNQLKPGSPGGSAGSRRFSRLNTSLDSLTNQVTLSSPHLQHVPKENLAALSEPRFGASRLHSPSTLIPPPSPLKEPVVEQRPEGTSGPAEESDARKQSVNVQRLDMTALESLHRPSSSQSRPGRWWAITHSSYNK